MRSQLEKITPEIAKQYLAKSAGNRPLKRRRIEQYKADMLAGKWQITPDGPCFDTNGVLKNAHHRLTAIVESGASVEMYVTYDVPESTTAYDIGDSRNAQQYLVYNEKMDKQLASNKLLAIARLHMYFACSESRHESDKATYADLGRFLKANRETALETLSLMSTEGGSRQILTGSAVGYALFCALKTHVSYEVLKRFCKIMATGFYESKSETAAIVLRNTLISGYDGSNRDIKARADLCKVAQQALYDFERGTPRTRAYAVKEAVYTVKWFEMCGVDVKKLPAGMRPGGR